LIVGTCYEIVLVARMKIEERESKGILINRKFSTTDVSQKELYAIGGRAHLPNEGKPQTQS